MNGLNKDIYNLYKMMNEEYIEHLQSLSTRELLDMGYTEDEIEEILDGVQ